MDHPGRWFFLCLIIIVFHAPASSTILEAVERHLPPRHPPWRADPDSTTIKISQQIWPLFYYSKRQKLLHGLIREGEGRNNRGRGHGSCCCGWTVVADHIIKAPRDFYLNPPTFY